MTTPARPRIALTVEQCWQPVPGGSGSYIVELARALLAGGAVDLVGLAARHAEPPGTPLPNDLRVLASRLPRVALYEAWSRLRRPRVRSPRPDVVHATTWAIPPGTGGLVVTIHDLAFLRAPEHFTARGNAFFRRALTIARDEADVIVVPSQTTADDCTTHGIEAGRIRVIPHGVRALSVTAADVAAFRGRHGLTRPYVLWTGTFEPRKNLGTLLDAYALLLERGSDLDLVLVGPSGWGGAGADVDLRLRSMPAGRVHLLGRLPEPDLHTAYAGARAFCFPSLWEGFGLPVLEAMAHGVPVVTSAGTSMAEIGGGAALLADPADAAQLAGLIGDAAGTQHGALAAASAANARRFTWARSAELHVAAYAAALVRH